MAKMEHFALFADDAPALKDFFVDVFGMRVILENPGSPPGFFLADDRGMALEIIGRIKGQSNVNQRWVCHVAFWVDDFHASYRDLQARGLTFETESFVDNDDFRTAFFPDPEGNRCQIIWRRKPLGS